MNAIVPQLRAEDFSPQLAAAGRILTYALASGEPEFGAWRDVAFVWAVRLSPTERAAILLAAAWAAGPEAVQTFVEGRMRRAGEPLPPFASLVAEAETWARFAARDELRAYFVEIWKALPNEDHVTFLDAVRPRRRAA